MIIIGNKGINSGDVQEVHDDDITIDGDVDNHSLVVLESTKLNGSITITGKIDGHSNVTLKATGDILIGTTIDGNSQVEVRAGGNVSLGGFVHKASADFGAHGTIALAEIDDGATVRLTADGDITVAGKIDGNEFDHGPSRVEAVSNRGSVTVGGKIDGESKVYLTAGLDVSIGHGAQLGEDDRKIDGDSFVTAIAGRNISLGGKISGSHTNVDFAAAGAVLIDKTIEGGATVRLLSGASAITVTGGIPDTSTQVTSWPVKPSPTGVNTNAGVPSHPWAATASLASTTPRAGYWWENWPQTFGYVAPFRVVPRSLAELAAAVVGSGNVDRPDLTPVKAIGGGWSFTDAALPFRAQAEVDGASILKSGAWRQEDMRHVLEGMNDLHARPMDLLPEALDRNLAFSTMYDQTTLRQITRSGAQLPASSAVRLIDTRSLASSLQDDFDRIRVPPPPGGGEILFHVEAGITIADLQQLLDHQKPRLALFTSGGSPGATLAGAISTATHGGEFRSLLLADCVRAVHLVGPGGEHWWIEGGTPVAIQANLQSHYFKKYKINGIQFIDSGWSSISGLTGQDVLDAVAVSMGTMGVIYSVVLAVREQFGLRQVVRPTSWQDLLTAAKVSENDLRAGDVAANQRVLGALMDGAVNGTGIARADNLYVDLAINPFKRDLSKRGGPPDQRDCWVVNRQETPALPDDANNPAAGMGDYMSALSRALVLPGAVDTVQDSKFAGRIFDFLSWGTDIVSNGIQDLGQVGRLGGFVTGLSDVSAGALAAASVQAVANVVNVPPPTDRGQAFFADLLTGFFHAMEGTAVERNSDLTAVSYKVGAIGWPEGGLPGRGLEVALDPDNAFSFLQTELLDNAFDTFMAVQNKPTLGYISVRVCPPTRTLIGMQQYGRNSRMAQNSVMIEVVAFRSPEANDVMDFIQDRALAWSPAGPKPLLHWGLENDKLSSAFLATTPLGQPYKGALTRLEAFRQIRDFLKNKQAPVFDNNFTARLGL